jgi:hypothetical protein
MEPVIHCIKEIHSPLYDRRLMILILKKTNGRRSFSENCRCSKIKEERRYRQYEPNQETESYQKESNKKTHIQLQEPFRP